MKLGATEAPTLRAELTTLAGLAWPVSLGGLGLLAMGAVDVAVVGRLGSRPLAALAAGNLWSYGVLVPLQFMLAGLDPLVAQAAGAGDRRAVGLGLTRGLLGAALLSVPGVLLMRQASFFLALLGQPAELLPLAQRWCEISAWTAPALLIFQVLRTWLQALGILRPITVVVMLANVLNLALNLGLVLGWWGMPALGVAGSALATGLSRLAILAGLLYAGRETLGSLWPRGGGAWALRPTLEVLWLGAPAAAQVGLEVWAFQTCALMMGWIGETALAANAVVLNLSSLSFMVPLGISTAAAVRVGNLIGAELPWRRAAWSAVGLGAGVMLGFAALFLALPGPLAAVFTEDPAVAALAVSLLPLVAAFQAFDGTQVTCIGALRGAGDLRIPALTALIAYWAVGLPLGWLLGFRLGWGPTGIWSGLALGLATAACLLLLRLVRTTRRGGARLRVGAPETEP